MKQLMMSLVIVGTALCSFSISEANASDYELQLFSVDDNMYAYITNSVYTDQLLISQGFSSGNPYANISNYVEPGINIVTLELYNGPKGYSYDWNFGINGVLSASGSCGDWNTYGCNYDSYAEGLVYVTDLLFSTSGTSVTVDNIYAAPYVPGGQGPAQLSATPLPSTWTMLIAGFVGLGFFAYRGTKKNSAGDGSRIIKRIVCR